MVKIPVQSTFTSSPLSRFPCSWQPAAQNIPRWTSQIQAYNIMSKSSRCHGLTGTWESLTSDEAIKRVRVAEGKKKKEDEKLGQKWIRKERKRPRATAHECDKETTNPGDEQTKQILTLSKWKRERIETNDIKQNNAYTSRTSQLIDIHRWTLSSLWSVLVSWRTVGRVPVLPCLLPCFLCHERWVHQRQWLSLSWLWVTVLNASKTTQTILLFWLLLYWKTKMQSIKLFNTREGSHWWTGRFVIDDKFDDEQIRSWA